MAARVADLANAYTSIGLAGSSHSS
jgi:hypothetical protein